MAKLPEEAAERLILAIEAEASADPSGLRAANRWLNEHPGVRMTVDDHAAWFDFLRLNGYDPITDAALAAKDSGSSDPEPTPPDMSDYDTTILQGFAAATPPADDGSERSGGE